MKPTKSPASMAAEYGAELASLLELERRHDELLGRLEELDARVEKVLAEWSVSRGDTAGDIAVAAASAGGL